MTRLLILGGTWFLGRTLAEQGLDRGWTITTFARGRSGNPVSGAVAVHGDRTEPEDVRALAAHGPWDAVIDTSGFEPETVRTSAQILEPHAGRYVFVSTVNAYQGWPDQPLTDDSPLLEPPQETPGQDEIAQGRTPAALYGAAKAASEQAAADVFGHERLLILRPGVLLGPYEYVSRLPWLLRRMQRGGRVLAAGPADQPIQPLDVRDLAAFTLDAINRRLRGAMNTTAPVGHATYGELLTGCNRVTGDHAELVWVNGEWLERQNVTQWSELPLWRTTRGAWNVTSAKAESAGLHARPLAHTVADTWEWLQRETLMPHGRQDAIGLAPGKEASLLAAWDAYANGSLDGGSARGADSAE